LKLEMLQGTVC